MKKIKANKLQLSRITVAAATRGILGGYYNTAGTGCGISYAAWCSESCHTCQQYCGTAQYSACNGMDCL